MSPLRLLVTGTWGTGKTTILDRLRQDFVVATEPARHVLGQDPTLADDWSRFARSLLDRSLADHSAEMDRPTIFDRGLPDCLAYARWFGVDTAPFDDAGIRLRYHDEALLFPSWEEIYTTDDLRKASFAMAEEFERILIETYEDLGYRLVEVPLDSVESREGFVRVFITRIDDHSRDREGNLE